MKKIFKNKIIQNGLFFILGAVIFGGIGVLATTYVLKSSEIQYTNDKSVQEAIDELYLKAENCGSGEVKDLILTPEILGSNINISYTGNYTDAKCVYGTDENYGNVGVIDNNMCSIIGTPNITYYYKITTLNNVGEIYSGSGSSTANAGATVVKNNLPTGVKAIIYLDPTNLGATCNEANSIIGSGTSGCMKWYAFKEDSSSYTMILDHNTTALVAWNSSGNNTSMKEVQTALTSDTTGWAGSPRLITGKEIADITGNTSWTTSTTSSGWFYFDSNSQTQTATSIESSKYYWLYDYTKGCTSYGCKVADSSTSGYWTSTPVSGSTSRAWGVYGFGYLLYNNVGNAGDFGVRPVITISKSNF